MSNCSLLITNIMLTILIFLNFIVLIIIIITTIDHLIFNSFYLKAFFTFI